MFLGLVLLLHGLVAGDLTKLRQAIQENDSVKVAALLAADRSLASARSPDGQGPSWWAMAGGGDSKIVGLLLACGAKPASAETDAHGKRALDLLPGGLTDARLAAWRSSAVQAVPVMDALRRKLISGLEKKVSRLALAAELDSLDD